MRLPSTTITATNVTAATGLGTKTSDANALIVEGSFTAAVGDVVEFTHATYPLKARFVLAATQALAYLNQQGAYVLENLSTPTNSSVVDIYAQDLSDLAAPPVLLGRGKAGTTISMPYQTAIDKNIRLYPISTDDNNNQTKTDFLGTNYTDIAVPKIAGSAGQPIFATSLQGVIDAAESMTIMTADYSTAGITLNKYAKVWGAGHLLSRLSGTNPIVTLPINSPDGLQTTKVAMLRDLNVNAISGSTRTGTGILFQGSAVLRAENCWVRGGDVGISLSETQFATFLSVKAYANNVGLYIRPSFAGGGGNSLSFYDYHGIDNKIGVFVDNSGNVYPNVAIHLFNPQLLGNEVCSLAVIGETNLKTIVTMEGGAPEANAAGAATYTYNSNVIPRCSIYGKHSVLNINNLYIGEYAAVDPCIILVDSDLQLLNVSGFGGAAAVLVSADASSRVTILGKYAATGTCHGVAKFDGSIAIGLNRGCLAGSLPIVPNKTIQNDLVDAEIGGIVNVNGATLTTAVDARGRYTQAAYLASAGTPDANAVYAGFTLVAGRSIYSVEMTADRDCRVRFSYYPDLAPVFVDLKNGERTRIVYFVNTAVHTIAAGAISIPIFPTDTSGPVIKFRFGQALSGALTDRSILASIDAIAAGAYNGPTFKLQINGSGADQLLATENILTLKRAYVSGVSFANGAAFALGKYEAGTALARTRLDLNLGADSDLDATAPSIAVMTWLATGKVGVGLTAPGQRLVVGDITGQNTLRINGLSTANMAPAFSLLRSGNREAVIAQTLSGLVIANTAVLANYNDATIDTASHLLIDSSGRVGIGTTSPTEKLDLQGAAVGGSLFSRGSLTAINNRKAYYGLDGTTIDTNDWAASAAGVTQNNKFLFASGNSLWTQGVASQATFPRGQSLVMEADVKNTVDGYMMVGWKDNDTSSFSFTAAHHYIYFITGGSFQIYENGASANSPAATWTVGTQYRIRIVLKTGGGAAYYISSDAGRNWTTLWAGNTTITSTPVRLGVAYFSGSFEIDNWEVYSTFGSNSLYGDKGNIVEVGSKVGLGVPTPLAVLHLKAGTATANTSPLKFTTGTNLTTAEAGVMEYNNTPHFTNSDATRRHVALAPNTTKVTAGAPYTNDGYVVINIGGTDFKVLTTA